LGIFSFLNSFISNRKSESESFMNNKKTVGQLGEEIARNALEKEGYRILEKNFSCKFGELDIVAEDDGVICFIEVNN